MKEGGRTQSTRRCKKGNVRETQVREGNASGEDTQKERETERYKTGAGNCCGVLGQEKCCMEAIGETTKKVCKAHTLRVLFGPWAFQMLGVVM